MSSSLPSPSVTPPAFMSTPRCPSPDAWIPSSSAPLPFTDCHGLPSPPATGHRAEKENRVPGAKGMRVAWSKHNEVHCLSSPPPSMPVKRTSNPRSILKKTAAVVASPALSTREETPEPEDPLSNLEYLVSPVLTIVAADESTPLSDIIDAYTTFMTRLRNCTLDTTQETDSSWPLLHPLREHRDVLISAFVRDLNKAHTDPSSILHPEESMDVDDPLQDRVAEMQRQERETLMLLSPQKTPGKKSGMSAEEVKFARDLCTVVHAVIKLLNVIFTVPCVCRVFTDEQLGDVMTALLSIPLADSLPTPNARKTCALAVMLIQGQRLPAPVLRKSCTRIAWALRRGIEGELGKEGKKGSASDGLKAIHDLCTYQPGIFVEPFVELLVSIFAALSSLSPNVKTQAAHALGGFAHAFVSMASTSATPSNDALRLRVSDIVAALFIGPSIVVPTPSGKKKKSMDSPLVRMIRTTLLNDPPAHMANSPIWGLHVLNSCTVLLGPALITQKELLQVVQGLITISMKSHTRTVRGFASLHWRALMWNWVQPALPTGKTEDEAALSAAGASRESYWSFVRSCVDMGAGVATIAALLGPHQDSDWEGAFEREGGDFDRAMSILMMMVKAGGRMCNDAIDALGALVGSPEGPQPTFPTRWNPARLLPRRLFSAIPGLLAGEWKTVGMAIKPLLAAAPQVFDVKPIGDSLLRQGGVWARVAEIWETAVAQHSMGNDYASPSDLLGIWNSLLRACIDPSSEERSSANLEAPTQLMIRVLLDEKLDLIRSTFTRESSPGDKEMKMPPPQLDEEQEEICRYLRIELVQDLWQTVLRTLPEFAALAIGEKLLAALVSNEEVLVQADDDFGAWAKLCARLCTVLEGVHLREFWNASGVAQARRKDAWERFLDDYAYGSHKVGTWEDFVILLDVPFIGSQQWAMDYHDIKHVEVLLQRAIDRSADADIEINAIVDHVAGTIAAAIEPSQEHATGLADELIARVRHEEALPQNLLEFVNSVLVASYPPAPRNKTVSAWLLRSVTKLIEASPVQVLESLSDGIVTWIEDEYCGFYLDDYTFNILPLYQTALTCLHSAEPEFDVVDRILPVIEAAFRGRGDRPITFREAFGEFYTATLSAYGDKWPSRSLRAIKEAWPLLTDEDDTQMATSIQHQNGSEADVPLDHGVDDSSAADKEEVQDALVFPESEDEDEVVQNRFHSAGVPLLPPFTPSCDASTPPKDANTRPITPRRPKKSSSSTICSSPGTPTRIAPSTPKRTPLSSTLGENVSPAKVLFSDEKENLSPIPLFMERLGVTTPSRNQKPSTLGKRRHIDDSNSDVVQKKSKRVDEDLGDELLAPGTDSATPPKPLRGRWSSASISPNDTKKSNYGPTEVRVAPRRKSDYQPLLGSDDSLDGEDEQHDVVLSSDDDPRDGQVTPHHLVSPVVRRAPPVNYDPPSDDSNMSSSPTQQVVARRTKRSRSFSQAPIPMIL